MPIRMVVLLSTGSDGRPTQLIEASDVRSRVVEIEAKFDTDRSLPEKQERKPGQATAYQNNSVPWDIIAYAMAMVLSVCVLCVVIVWALLWAVGEEAPGLDIVIRAFMGQRKSG